MSQERLAKLKDRRAKLSARIQAMEAREKAQARKQDTRRKILVGAYFIEQMKAQRWDELCGLMDGFLVRDTDRALFGLAPKGKAGGDESVATPEAVVSTEGQD